MNQTLTPEERAARQTARRPWGRDTVLRPAMQITTLPELKRTYYAARRAMLERCNESRMTQTQAAKALGVSLTCLNNMVKRHGIEWARIEQGRRSA
jgi:transcriptional regulator with GAF, ATPase, and Fis domain